MGLKPDLWQASRFLEWTLIRLGKTNEADIVSQDNKMVLDAMTQSLSGADLALFLLNKWTDAELYMAAEIEKLTRTKRKLVKTRWHSALLRPWYRFRIARRLVKLLDYADRYKATIFEPRTGEEPRLPKRSKSGSMFRLLRHPRSRLTVVWIVLPDMTLIARAGWFSLDFGVSAVSRIQIREWVRHWHEAIRDEELGKAKLAMRQLAEALQIDELMQSVPRRAHTLDIVPDDVLHGVPFAALRYGESDIPGANIGHYLGATLAIVIQSYWRRSECKSAELGNALVVGVSYGAGTWKPLPNAATESRKIANLLQAQNISVSTPTSRQEIMEQLPKAGFFHIACHGTFQPDRPDESGLVIITKSRDVEMLTVRDICRVDLSHMKQVVLSGCWGADNFIFPGRWIVSLPGAFCQGGAQTVIASLWPVDDAIGACLFAILYQQNVRMPPERLLRQIRQSCIDGSFRSSDDTKLDDPFFGAGIQVYKAYG